MLIITQISHWQSFVNATNASVIGNILYNSIRFVRTTVYNYSALFGIIKTAFTEPVFAFIENAIRNGESVLVSYSICLFECTWRSFQICLV